ncbi:MAG: M56 family metallopeptidase, partial [Tangfeifania sp.]
MNSAVNFILESGISLSLFALVYVLFLRKETFFKLNRFFLLGSVLFSVVLPFLRFQVFNANPVMLNEITVTPYRNLIEAVTVYGKDLSGSIEQAILSADAIIFVYLTGVVFLFFRLLARISRIAWLINRYPVQKMDGFNLVILSQNISPFSFLNYVFLSDSLQKEDDHHKMIAHELEHVKQGHTFDVIILEILSVFQWFNPFMWMLRRAIRENHEYLADQAVLSSGINRGYYKKLLLNQYIGEKFEIANNFNYSLIKNRIKMMSKLESPKFANWKMVFGILAAAGLIIVFACEKKESFEMPHNAEEQTLKMTVQHEKLKIEGAVENLQKVKQLFSNNPDFVTDYDSLQNILLLKKDNDAEEIIQPETDEV